MGLALKHPTALFKEAYRLWRGVRPELLAGGLAYFAIFSAAPLFVILIALFGRGIARGQIMAQLDQILSPRMGDLLREWLVPHHEAGLPSLTVLSVLILLYGASQIFVQLRASLNVIWGLPLTPAAGWRGYFKSTVGPLLMILAAGLFILAFALMDAGIGIASRMFGAVLPGLGYAALWKVASAVCSFALFTLFFAGIFKWVPSQKPRWRDVWPGAVLTSGLFALGKFGLALYFSWQTFDSLYGTAGSLIAFMVWIYVSAQIFLFGAAFTRVYSKTL